MEGVVDHLIDVEVDFFCWNAAREAQQACDERLDPSRQHADFLGHLALPVA